MEQRYQAVLAVIRDGVSIVEVARRFGVSRQSVHSWLLRYEVSGMPGLMNQSHRPAGCAHQMSAQVDVKIVELRRRNIFWGPKRLQHELARLGIEPVPSLSAIYRCLKRANLIEPHARKERDKKFKRWERGGPMELWQMDVVGGILLTDGKELKCLTGVDDHSRLCVMAGLMVRATSRSVCDHFANAMRIHGVPQEILTDNGKVFTGRFGHKDTECSLIASAGKMASIICLPLPDLLRQQERSSAFIAAFVLSSCNRAPLKARRRPRKNLMRGLLITTPCVPIKASGW